VLWTSRSGAKFFEWTPTNPPPPSCHASPAPSTPMSELPRRHLRSLFFFFRCPLRGNASTTRPRATFPLTNSPSSPNQRLLNLFHLRPKPHVFPSPSLWPKMRSVCILLLRKGDPPPSLIFFSYAPFPLDRLSLPRTTTFLLLLFPFRVCDIPPLLCVGPLCTPPINPEPRPARPLFAPLTPYAGCPTPSSPSVVLPPPPYGEAPPTVLSYSSSYPSLRPQLFKALRLFLPMLFEKGSRPMDLSENFPGFPLILPKDQSASSPSIPPDWWGVAQRNFLL